MSKVYFVKEGIPIVVVLCESGLRLQTDFTVTVDVRQLAGYERSCVPKHCLLHRIVMSVGTIWAPQHKSDRRSNPRYHGPNALLVNACLGN